MSSAITAPLPTAGVFPVQMGESLMGDGGKKRKRPADELVAFKYAFKPASISTATPGSLETDGSSSKQLVYDLPGGAQQVFDGREDVRKGRECVMIWDENAQTFTLHALPSTIHFTLNRSASTSRSTGKAPSISGASTSSSSSIPLARNQQSKADASGDTEPEEAVPRPTKGGKGLPRKAVPEYTPPVPAPAGKGKAGDKKSAKKGAKSAAAPEGKIKSVEIIEDSDEEDEEDDEFAKMVGEMMGGDEHEGAGEGDDSEEEYEEEDDEDLLGGATLVAPKNTNSEDHSEWL